MFIIEKFIQDRRTKVENWENARDKWVNEGTYRSRREYDNVQQRPGSKVKELLRVLAISLIVVASIAAAISVVIAENHHNNSKPKTVVHKVVTSIKVGNMVQVVYGDYKDSVGQVVKVSDDSAIIKLTNSTLTKAECNASGSCSDGGGVDNGQLLEINALKNLVSYKT